MSSHRHEVFYCASSPSGKKTLKAADSPLMRTDSEADVRHPVTGLYRHAAATLHADCVPDSCVSFVVIHDFPKFIHESTAPKLLSISTDEKPPKIITLIIEHYRRTHIFYAKKAVFHAHAKTFV